MARPNILLVIFVLLALGAGFLIPQYPSYIVICVTLGLAIFIISFINVDWSLYILIFAMLLSPEFTISESAGASLQRGVTLRFEDFLLVLIGFSWFTKNAFNKSLGLFLKTPLNKAILFYVLSCMISTGLGILAGRVAVKTGSLFVLKYIEYYIVFFMVVNHVKSTDQVKRLLFCLFLTCFIASIFGILQIPEGVRVSAPFEGEIGEPNTFGGYLLLIGAITSGIVIKTENNKLKLLLILFIITIIIPFLFTQSRSSYLGFIPVCLTIGIMTNRRIIVVGLLVIGFLVSPLFLPIQVKNRILHTFNQPEASGQIKVGSISLDTSTSARIIRLEEIMRDFPRHPILGFGVAGYGFVDSQIPRTMVETGIIGLLAFFYLVYSIFKLTINHLKRIEIPEHKGLTIGFLAGFIGLLFHSLGANTFIIVRIMEPFWFIAGIIAVLPTLERQREAQTDESTRRTRKFAAATPLPS